ncbi:MAG: DUF3047 domain-containing protein [Candidatus Sericytochromatia bacterium]|nr:DUF3047 domain-containing protein [Candidatus Sericytochromatia bacterium]
MTRQWLSSLRGAGVLPTAWPRHGRAGRWAAGLCLALVGLGPWGGAGPAAWASSLPAAGGIPAGRAGTADAPRLLGDLSAAAWATWENTTHFPWEPRNVYTRLDTPQGPVVRVDSQGAASMLLRHVTLDVAREPIVTWRWRIAAPMRGADESDRSRDDCAARVHFMWGLRSRADILSATGLAYVWGRARREGAMAPSPFTGQVGVFTLRSGERGAGAWQTERRDLDADYRAFFKQAPPGPVTAVVLLTDTDQTKVSATAWYGPVWAGARR